MVSEPDTKRCASEEVEPRREWTKGGVPARTLSPEGGRLGGLISIREGNECQRGRWAPKGGGSHIGWVGEQNILYKDVETSP